MKMAFSQAARADLLAIGHYVFEQNPTRALPFMDELHSACVEIAAMPHAFVELLRILHGARDYVGILRRLS